MVFKIVLCSNLNVVYYKYKYDFILVADESLYAVIERLVKTEVNRSVGILPRTGLKRYTFFIAK